MKVRCCFESGAEVGSGHSMRCATLAQELVDRGHRVDAVAVGTVAPFVRTRFETCGVETRRGLRGSGAALADDVDIWIIDGYGLDRLVVDLVAADRTVAVIDDNGDLALDGVACLVNQNLHAGGVDYSNVNGELLLGPRYALLRRGVRDVRRVSHPRGNRPAAVLVTMGGTDPTRSTVPVVERLLALGGDVAQIDVAIATSHPDRHRVDRLVGSSGRVRLADADLTGSLSTCDLAVVGAGTTMWEVAYVGIPAVAVIVADNQVPGGRAAAAAGIAVAVEGSDPMMPSRVAEAAAHLLRDPIVFATMSARGRDAFDGHGVERVADALENL